MERGGQVKTPRSRTDLTKRPKSTKYSTMSTTWPFSQSLNDSPLGKTGEGSERKDLEQNQIPATD